MKNDLTYFTDWELTQELRSRGYIEGNSEYDVVDGYLYDDIIEVFDSLSCADRQKLHSIVLNFKN